LAKFLSIFEHVLKIVYFRSTFKSTDILGRKFYIYLFSVLFSLTLKAQDAQFSQFYANPLYLAPSFAGLTEGSRLGTNYRNQWPELPGKFITYAVSFDHNFDAFNSGLGVLILRDQAGSGYLRTTNIGVQYAYDIQINNMWHVRPGVHFAYTERAIDFYKLIFNDQLSAGGTNPGTIEIPPLNRVGDIDFGFSAMGYSELFWFGFSLDHLLRPNQSLYDFENDDVLAAKVPIKYQVFGGTKIVKQGRLIRPLVESIQLAFLFKKQAQFQQLDLGMYWYKNPVVLGVWYRGLPGISKGGQDAIIFLAGYKIEQFNFGYSYDFTISRLIGSTGGVHEISLTYSWKAVRIQKKPRMVPCPDF
jgi:type IX secretion system PorP/SprF family membrane protein